MGHLSHASLGVAGWIGRGCGLEVLEWFGDFFGEERDWSGRWSESGRSLREPMRTGKRLVFLRERLGMGRLRKCESGLATPLEQPAVGSSRSLLSRRAPFVSGR
jgi:hypothetical protein